MPDFPRYQSKGQLTTQTPSVSAPTDNSGEMVAKAGQQIGSGLQEAAIKWSNAVDTIQKTTATANFKTGLLDIQQRAANDPDYNNSDQYFKEIEKLKSDNLKGFSSKSAEAETMLNFNYDAKVAQIQIDNLYKKKMVDVGQASAIKMLDLMSRDSGDIENRISKFLGPQIRDGIFDHKEALMLQKEYVRKAKYNSFLGDLNSNPAITEEKLTKNEYGFDIDQLDKARNIFDSESKKIKAVTENDVLTSYLNGEDINQEQIKQLMNENKIDATFAESMIKKINDPKPDELSKDQAYIEFQNKGAEAIAKGDKATTEEIIKLMTDTMQAHAKGLLDKSDVQRILKDRNELVQDKLEKISEDILSKKNPKNWLERISFWSDEYADKKPEIKARMYRKLIDGMMKGEDPQSLLMRVVDQETENHLSENLKKSDRQYAINPDTKKRIYSDDGGATWFDEKSGKEIK